MAERNTLISKKPKLMDLPLDMFPTTEEIVRLKLNVREPENYDQTWLQDSLAESGQKMPGIAVPYTMPDGTKKYRALVGNLRLHNIRRCAERGIIDPKTVKMEVVTATDGTKTEEPRGGKVFSTISMWVYEGANALTPDEETQVIDDQGEQTPLNKAEVFNSVVRNWELLGVGATGAEGKIAIRLRKLLDLNFPVEAAKLKEYNGFNGPDGMKNYITYRHGKLNFFRTIIECPIVVRDAYVRKLKALQSWPKNDNVFRALKAAYLEDKANDPTHQYTRENPGPKFLTLWEQVKADGIAADLEQRAPKKFNGMSSGETEKFIETCDSRLGKAWMKVQRRELIEEGMIILKNLCLELEAGMNPDQKRRLDDAFLRGAVNATKPPVPGNEPAKAEAEADPKPSDDSKADAA